MASVAHLTACGPAVVGLSALYFTSSGTDQLTETIASECDTPNDEAIGLSFTDRILTEFGPPIACSGTFAGVDNNGRAYGTLSMSFANAQMIRDTDANGGIIQYVTIAPEAGLDRGWFVKHRAGFANGYDQYIDWETDSDGDPLVEQYWAPGLGNVQVQFTVDENGFVTEVWFSDPN